MSTSATQAVYWAQDSAEQVLLGQQHRRRWNLRILEDTEVVPVHVADVVVPVGVKVRLSPSCIEAPTAMGTEEEELFPPTMNGGGKALEQDALQAWAEAPPALSMRVPSQNKEGPEQRSARSDLAEEAEDAKG